MSGLDNVYFKAVAAGSGRIYSFKEYETLLKKIGFKIHKKISCKTWTPHGLIIAKK